MSTFKLFSGSANPEFAKKVGDYLGMCVSDATLNKFSDGEISVQITQSVRGQDVYIIQPTCAPTNDNLMELLIMIDALKRSSAKSINAVIPYYGYARQDRKSSSKSCLLAQN